MPKKETPASNPLGDPKAFRGYSTKLKDLAAPQKRSDFLPPLEKSVGGFVLELMKIVLIAFVIIIPVRTFILQPFYVQGASMEPNFHDNEYLIIDELSYRLHSPNRGDVVVLRNPSKLSEFFIKRVIGLPGERIVVSDGRVEIINPNTGQGGYLNESAYLPKGLATFGNVDVTLGTDEFYVMGDNRPYSLDSRSFGPIIRKEIIGRTAVRAWPLNKLSVFGRVAEPLTPNAQPVTYGL
jgi:signal peptidase I